MRRGGRVATFEGRRDGGRAQQHHAAAALSVGGTMHSPPRFVCTAQQLQSQMFEVRNGHGAPTSGPGVRAVAADAGACRLRFGVSVAWQDGLHSEQHRAQKRS
jgi:hypothetical protein